MSTIGNILGLVAPNPKTFQKAVPLSPADPALLYGIELEIENTQTSDWIVPGLRGEADGSLRNNGYEYITSPMTYSNAAFCLGRFFEKAKVTEDNYSERCSVHVHTNCIDLTTEQLTSILLLYQTFEKVLFDFVGHDRDKNIFCVPWSHTTLNYGIAGRVVSGDAAALRRWQKYTALNLLPLLEQGTIEWRHLHGTPDLELILKWMDIIGSMFQYSRNVPLTAIKQEIIDLNTTSQYRQFMSAVFKDHFPSLLRATTEVDIEDGVLATKYSLLEAPARKTTLRNPLNAWPQPEDLFRPAAGPQEIRMPQGIQEAYNRMMAEQRGRIGGLAGLQAAALAETAPPGRAWEWGTVAAEAVVDEAYLEEELQMALEEERMMREADEAERGGQI